MSFHLKPCGFFLTVAAETQEEQLKWLPPIEHSYEQPHITAVYCGGVYEKLAYTLLAEKFTSSMILSDDNKFTFSKAIISTYFDEEKHMEHHDVILCLDDKFSPVVRNLKNIQTEIIQTGFFSHLQPKIHEFPHVTYARNLSHEDAIKLAKKLSEDLQEKRPVITITGFSIY